MTVTSCHEEEMSRSGEATGEQMEESRLFLVKCDSALETIYTLAQSGYLPAYLDVHPQSPYATCRKISIVDQPAKTHYHVRADYSSAPLDQREKEKEIFSPLDRPARISAEGKTKIIAIERDINGKAVTNSAGEYFDPPPERPLRVDVITIEKNVSGFPTWILAYNDAVNDEDFQIAGETIPKGRCKAGNVKLSNIQTENDIEYRVVSFDLEIMPEVTVDRCLDGTSLDFNNTDFVTPDAWDLILLDQGLRYLDTSVESSTFGQLINATDDNGDPVTSPILLNGIGEKLDYPGPSTAYYRAWQQYRKMDFSALPLE